MAEKIEREQTLSEEQITNRLKDIARGWSHPLRSPVLRTPADEGLDYEDVTFPSQDGVPLEAWFIPCAGSDRLVIVNHPMMFNRYGCPTHLEPWRSFGAASGNTFEVDYVADYRILHEAGYNVLTYDERNFGLSGTGNGGLNSGGRYQGRDVIGSLLYARNREDLKDMAIGLFSRCNGANANLYASRQAAATSNELANLRCKSGPTRLNPRNRAAVRMRSASLPPALSTRAMRKASSISSEGMQSAFKVAPLSADRSRTGGDSDCARVNQNVPSDSSSGSRLCATSSADRVAVDMREPAFSLPKHEAIRRATSSTWIGPSAATIRFASSASVDTATSWGSCQPFTGKTART